MRKFDGLTLKFVDSKKCASTGWSIITVIVFDAESTPVDRFELYRHQGVWYAWTSDTVSQERIARRHRIAAAYERHVKKRKSA